MSEYVGGGLALAAVVAVILGVLFMGGQDGRVGDTSILPEAHAGFVAAPDYGWKGAISPQADPGGQVGEFY